MSSPEETKTQGQAQQQPSPEPVPTGHLKWPLGVWPSRMHLVWGMGVTGCLGSGFRATSKPLHLVGTNATATCLGHPCVISER